MCECEHGFMHVQYCNARSSWTPNACKRTCLRCFQVRADPPPTNSTVSAASKLVQIADHHQRTVLRHLQTAMCTLLFFVFFEQLQITVRRQFSATLLEPPASVDPLMDKHLMLKRMHLLNRASPGLPCKSARPIKVCG